MQRVEITRYGPGNARSGDAEGWGERRHAADEAKAVLMLVARASVVRASVTSSRWARDRNAKPCGCAALWGARSRRRARQPVRVLSNASGRGARCGGDARIGASHHSHARSAWPCISVPLPLPAGRRPDNGLSAHADARGAPPSLDALSPRPLPARRKRTILPEHVPMRHSTLRGRP
jgi:hypothetical protein